MSRHGLYNNGNTCFMNAALQCLSVTPSICNFIRIYNTEDENLIKLITKFNLGKCKTDTIKLECRKILDNQKDTLTNDETQILTKLEKSSDDIFIYISFKDLIKKLDSNRQNNTDNNTISQIDRKPLDASPLLSITRELASGSIFENLFNGSQNDPHEFLAYILDRLHNSKSTSIQIKLPSNLNEIDNYYKLYLQHFKTRYENDYSYFVKNLYYYIINCVECSKCKNISTTFNPNDIICVPVPTQVNDKMITIYDCLNEMFKTDTIVYTCENCGNKDKNLIENKIFSKPKTFIIKLKRYSSTLNGRSTFKLNNMICYPDILNINKYFCGKAETNYKLYGIINHSGSLNGGHYYSYVKNINPDYKTFNEQWLCCNDTQVSNISDEQAMASQNAYMLFYSLIE